MQLKISWADLPSEVIPHSSNDSDEDMDVVSSALIDTLIQNMPSEIVELDPGRIIMASLLSSRLVSGIIDYLEGRRWGGKYYSGDVSATLGETMAYAVLEKKFDVKFLDVIPLRQVKYLGFSPDAMIDVNKYPKLLSFLGGKGLLFLNARGSYKWSQAWLMRNLKRDLIQVEKVRYPDNFAMLTYLYRDEEWKMMMVVIRP
ncbi:hypothetical protein L3N51_00539 [Metallosphaera sp. J1]|uniref:hypothetical protein n=1 Tax=Metallosphaera javensis (ex Hofmann et al. 2022) TaxID=99938 RepID=UPI001EDFAAD7|nr:hypothetical protein [Metallosphaera javensis (ex Hofmann et al. 2022)]MCG3108258.1 hypothetical protein [Metallosphaera javensis (ex Hofmann et al. 2022)]